MSFSVTGKTYQVDSTLLNNLQIFSSYMCFTLTPEGHEHCIEHGAWVVKQVCKLCIAAHFAQVPEAAAYINVTQWTHVEIFVTAAHFCG
jgi:hypothetical protein